MAASGYYVFTEALDGGRHVTVPNIIDLPITDAALVLAESGLEMGAQQQVAHPVVPKYHVIVQRPAAGRVVRSGRRVHPTVSMGANFLKTSSLVSKTLDAARREITQSRFRTGTVARIPHESPRDTVIAQDPPAGANIENNSSIHLLVSEGLDRRASFMPDIRGKPVQEALQALSAYNVTLIPNKVEIEGAQEDVVLDQDPPPDTLVYEGQVVTYDVKPSGAVVLPDTRFRADVRHEMRYDWFDKDVRVDLVDRRGNRQTVYAKRPLFDEQSKSVYVAGKVIGLRDINYVGEATIEVYVNGALVESYYLRNGEEPVKTGQHE